MGARASRLTAATHATFASSAVVVGAAVALVWQAVRVAPAEVYVPVRGPSHDLWSRFRSHDEARRSRSGPSLTSHRVVMPGAEVRADGHLVYDGTCLVRWPRGLWQRLSPLFDVRDFRPVGFTTLRPVTAAEWRYARIGSASDE